MTQAPKAPAGWYPHPSMAGTQRYWNGARWTDNIAPTAPVVQPSTTAAALPGWLFGVGYVTALGLPIVGFAIGVVLLAKGQTNHGVGMMVLSVVVTALVLGGGLL